MSQTLDRVRSLVSSGEIVISVHGYDELAQDNIAVADVVLGVATAAVVEEYPDYYKGSCILVLQQDGAGRPVHIVWGIPRDAASPAVVITGYRPDPTRWSDDFTRRLP